MKKTIILLSVFLFSLSAIAQKKGAATAPDMPTDETTKLVTYTDKVDESGVTQKELFKRAQKWIKEYYPNPTGVVQSADSVEGKTVGKAAFDAHRTAKDGSKIASDRVQYTITILFKDGKYKYEITKINIKAPSYVPIEKYFDEKAENHEEHFNTLTEADEYFTALVHSLKERMEKPSTEAKKSDW